jgi:hypothetical protein
VARTCLQKSKLGTGTVTVQQGAYKATLDFTVVGEPDKIELVPAEKTIQTGLDAKTCPKETETKGFVNAVALPEKTVFLARALDSDGTAVTGAFVNWKTDHWRKGIVATDLTPTLDLGGLGIGTANVICGTDDTGSVTVTARTIPLTARLDGSLCYESAECPFELDPMAGIHSKSVPLTVRGPPANLKITLSPAKLVCDGTAGSTISIAVTDTDNNAVANGNDVHFDVKTLGAASPVVVKTLDGGAVATVVPLSGVLQGVPVVVTAGNVQESKLISCEATISPVPLSSAQPAPAVVPPPPSARILPPPTGSGGWAR